MNVMALGHHKKMPNSESEKWAEQGIFAFAASCCNKPN